MRYNSNEYPSFEQIIMHYSLPRKTEKPTKLKNIKMQQALFQFMPR